MAGRLILGIANPALDANGKVDSGATLTFYLDGTSTLQSVYSDDTLATPLTNPLSCDASGRFPQVWAPDNTVYSVKWAPTGASPITYDDITPVVAIQSAPVTPFSYGAVGDNSTDDTAAFNAWLTAIKGGYGFIPVPPVAYKLPNGLTISGHNLTKITCAPKATINGAIASGSFLIAINNCLFCDFDFPQLNTGNTGGAGGIVITSSVANATNNKICISQLTGPGRAGTKPASPCATGASVGIKVLGPSVGSANYYNLIKAGTFIQNFDTGIAFHTPSGGSMNANANIADKPHIEGFWYGCYTNSTENRFVDAQLYNTSGTDSGHMAECFHIGDGTYGSVYNYCSGVAEPGSSNVQFGVFDVNALNNWIEGAANTDHGVTDKNSAPQNSYRIQNQWLTNSPVQFYGGIQNCKGMSSTSTVANNLCGHNSFASTNTQAITFATAEPDSSYRTFVTGDADETFWVTNQTTTGFTVHSSNATSSADFDWMIVR